jgi:hypothetical protein
MIHPSMTERVFAVFRKNSQSLPLRTPETMIMSSPWCGMYRPIGTTAAIGVGAPIAALHSWPRAAHDAVREGHLNVGAPQANLSLPR